MNILQKIKKKLRIIALPFFLAIPTDKKEITPVLKQSEDEKDTDISEEDAIKFRASAIEYTPENKIKMITYYQDDRDAPKSPYIVGQVGTRLSQNSRELLGKGFKVKRNA